MILSFLSGMTVHCHLSTSRPIPTAVTHSSTTITYGHVHMAKTGGTTLNGELAVKYERICGHKGYSWDAIATNQRVQELQESLNQPGLGLYQLQDSYNTLHKGYNRGRVPPSVMWEMGFHNCDWISIEDPGWTAWRDYVHVPDLELHVPCRDPIDHLLSQCHYKKKNFVCEPYENNHEKMHPGRNLGGVGESPVPLRREPLPKKKRSDPIQTRNPSDVHNLTLEEQIEGCMVGIHRFDHRLHQVTNNIKCFDYSKQSQYIQYMDQRLQRRRVTGDYVYRASDRTREKEPECLLKASPQLQDRVRTILLEKYDYYQFCDQCTGSDMDLLA
jgi:hypothetical protein